MRALPGFNHRSTLRLCFSLIATCSLLLMSLYTRPSLVAHAAQSASPETVQASFSNPAPIAPADRASNNAGTNPGLPPVGVYPSTVNVTGQGVITKVTVTFAITSTFPDDFDILLVGPTGARSLVMSDAGGGGDVTNVSLTFDQSAAAAIADTPTVITAGTYKPSNYAGLATPEPNGMDNFPTPGPGLLAYTADFSVFNGTQANGTWSLYVVDDQNIDTMSLPSGWTLNITAATPGAGKILDFDGDGKTDPVVKRNTGGGGSGQNTWFILNSGGAPASTTTDWGIQTDFVTPADYDGDGKTDIAVWRAGPPFGSYFYILQSSTGTLRTDQFGQSGDDPSVIGDYDGDGKADPAVYRAGAASGDHSFWYYRSSVNGLIIGTEWGQNGDFPAPGDYDGDHKYDYVVQRNAGGGQARFFFNNTTSGQSSTIFGTPTDVIVPGDYDGDGKFDLAVRRGSGGQLLWYILNSSDLSTSTFTFGASATDFSVQGDYDGDGKTDVAVWRPDADPTLTRFYWRRSSDGVVASVNWGQNGDYPVANYNSH